jgi:NAD(P)-dependent dehydrogenase (short-subunit alcohol dehydrogenase family)
MDPFNLDNKIALITGASRGIGEAIAMRLAEKGALCILVSRKIEGVKAVEQKIIAGGGKAEAAACHLGDLQQIDGLIKGIEETHGRLDILVNNAGANPYFGEMAAAEEWAWDKTHDVNLKGPFFMIQKAVPLMKKSGQASIINVSSINGVVPAPFQGIYSITKAGMISMTKAYAQELAGANIRVNALLPGLTETKFASALFTNDEIYKFAVEKVPMNRHAVPMEMAGAVLYLVSGASSYTTGTCIVCDGGMLI